jgi:MerR HTH family regulatory protein
MGLQAVEGLIMSTPATEYYPGSSRPIMRHANRHTEENRKHSYAVDPDWDSNPRKGFMINGVEKEFFTVGHLAQALGRRPGTIRNWEREGIIPKATFQVNSESPNGRRRLYSREQVEGLVKLAQEEGILIRRQSPIGDTKFTARAIELFRILASSN